MCSDVAEIQKAVYSLGEKIGAPKSLLIVRFSSSEDGRPYVEVKSGFFDYVCSERGFEIYRKSAASMDELLYWIISGVAFELATDYELANRVAGADSRRIIFSRYISLLSLASGEWGKRGGDEVRLTLMSAPYSDLPQ